MKKLIEAILTRVDRCISTEIAAHLRFINEKIDDRPDKPFEVTEIYLN